MLTCIFISKWMMDDACFYDIEIEIRRQSRRACWWEWDIG